MSQSKRGGFLRDDSTLALVTSPFTSGPMTVADLPANSIMPHRGAGGQVAMDDALSSIDLIATIPGWKLSDGGDVRLTSDSALVNMHDATTTRTTNTAGTISAMTASAVAATRMLNFPYGAGRGISAEAPPSYDQWLAKVKSYGMIATSEAKVTAAIPGMISAIQAAGMVNQVMFFSFSGTDLAAARAAGLKVALMQDGTTNIGAAAILTSIGGAAPDYVGYDYTRPDLFTASWLSTLAAAGIKFTPYTLSRRAQLAAETARVNGNGGIVALTAGDNPAWMAAAFTPLNADPFSDAASTMLRGQVPSSLSPAPIPYVSGGRLHCDGLGSQWALQGWGSRNAQWSKLDFSITYDVLDTQITRWAGVGFGCADDRDWHSQATATTKGVAYSVGMRQNGGMIAARNDGDAVAATGMATEVTTVAVTAGQTVPFRIEFLPANVIKFTRLDTGHSLQFTDSTYRGGHFHFGKNLSGGSNNGQYSFSAVTVTP